MKSTFLSTLRLLPISIFAVGAVWLAFAEKEGWGWCVFAALVLGSKALDRLPWLSDESKTETKSPA